MTEMGRREPVALAPDRSPPIRHRPTLLANSDLDDRDDAGARRRRLGSGQGRTLGRGQPAARVRYTTLPRTPRPVPAAAERQAAKGPARARCQLATRPFATA